MPFTTPIAVPIAVTITGSISSSTDTSTVSGKIATLIKPTDAQLDTFGRMRISTPRVLGSFIFRDDLLPVHWEQITSNGGTVTHQLASSSALLAPGVNANAEAIMQTKRYWTYQPGQSQQIIMTTIVGTGSTNVIKEFGYGDNNNGLFFQQSGTNVNVVKRSSVSGTPVNNVVSQSAWNLDVFDGSHSANNPSGLLYEPMNINAYIIDFQWSGAGHARFGFDMSGSYFPVHKFNFANTIREAYMRTPALPIRFKVMNNGVPASPNSLSQVCSAVVTEGVVEQVGFTTAGDNGPTAATVSTSLTSVLAVRLKSAYNRRSVFIRAMSVLNTGLKDAQWKLLLNPVMASSFTTFASQSNGSSVEFSKENIVVSDVNTIAATGFCLSNSETNEQFMAILPVVANFSGTSDIVVLAVKATSVTTDVFGIIKTIEII